MPVLDFHVHAGTRGQWNPWVVSYFQETNPQFTNRFGDTVTPEGLLECFDEEAVDRAVILAEYAPKSTGVVPNEWVVAFCESTDRLVPFGALDLDEKTDTGSQAQRCVEELGCRGFKLMPTYAHFYPDDPRLYPAYEVARDLGVPMMFHTGTSIFKGSRIRYGHPLLLDDVAEDFPDLAIILCHGGRPFWYKEAEWMLRRHRNTYIDVSGIPPRQLPAVFPRLEKHRDRFLFGSDWPGVPSISAQIRAIRELPLSPQTIEGILWENGARLLNLDQ